MLSIIIPTLNEEECLPRLLESIKEQNFNDYEITVADGNSQDNTVEIAKRYGCKIVKGGLPAKGRNVGAEAAKGNLFLFVDGDTILPENFLELSLKEFRERKLGVAGFHLLPYKKNVFLKYIYDLFYNRPISVMERFLPCASNAILVKKELHQKLGGFDEEIKIGEDHAYAAEGAKLEKFGVIKSTNIFFSTKRYECDGWLNTWIKYVLAGIYVPIFGPVKSNIFNYRFGHYAEEERKKTLRNSKKILKVIKSPLYILNPLIKSVILFGAALLALLVTASMVISKAVKKNP